MIDCLEGVLALNLGRTRLTTPPARNHPVSRAKEECQYKNQGRPHHHEWAGWQIGAQKGKEGTGGTGGHSKHRSQKQHDMHPVGQKVGCSRGGYQHGRNQHDSHCLQGDNHTAGQKQHQDIMNHGHRKPYRPCKSHIKTGKQKFLIENGDQQNRQYSDDGH